MLFILRKLKEVYYAKGKSFICFVDLEKSFDRVPMKV